MGRDIHAPGYYVHIAPDECFLAAGIWHPDPATLGAIRQAIVDEPERWQKATSDKLFLKHWYLAGDRLQKPPRGFEKDHPQVDDLKRKDFIAAHDLTEQDVLDKRFLNQVATCFAAARPLMQFLCKATRVPF